MSKLAIGTAGQILTSTGTAPQWSTLSGVAVTTFSAGTTGLTPSSATSGAVTLAGTLNVANGGTGLTSLTSGNVPYGNGTSAFSSSNNFNYDGANLGVSTAIPPNTIYPGLFLAYTTSIIPVGGEGGLYYNLYAVGTQLKWQSGGFGGSKFIFGNGNFVWAGDTTGGTANTNATLTEFMRLTTTGLGIGTSSPTAKLVVASGNTLLGHNTLDNYGGNVDIRSAYQVRAANTPTQLFVSDSAGSQTIDTGGAIDLGGYTSTLSRAYTYARIQGLANAGSGYGGYLSLMTTNAGGSVTERVRIATVGTFIIKNDYQEQTYTANSSTAITLDIVTNGTDQVITLTGTATITMPTATAGKSFLLKLKTGAGSYTVTWTTVKWPSGTAPTLTSTASRMDIFSFFSDGTNWYGTTVGQNYTP